MKTQVLQEGRALLQRQQLFSFGQRLRQRQVERLERVGLCILPRFEPAQDGDAGAETPKEWAQQPPLCSPGVAGAW
jgi:hypothetical protein